MDWAKILFCLYLALANTASSLEIGNSPTETTRKGGKINSKNKSLNSTQNRDEKLEASPSEAVHQIQKPVILPREQKNALLINKDYEKVASVKRENEKEVIKTGEDLIKEANGYSHALAFPDTTGSVVRGSGIPDLWHVVPQIFPFINPNEFTSHIPTIESQSFINNPELSSVQINYTPPKIVEGRKTGPSYGRNHNGRQQHESENNPGHGHAVHTETTDDFGRFLPVTYKSKIEKEAEELIKRQKSQNETIDRSQSQKRKRNEKKKQRTTENYRHPKRRPINTAFFHKGSFDDAYPFEDSGEEEEKHTTDKYPKQHHYTTEKYPKQHHYTTEKYPKQHHYTTESKEPATSTETGGTYNSKQPVRPTHTYKPQYSYSVEQYPPQGDVYHDDPHHRDLHHEVPHHIDANHGGLHFENQHHTAPPHHRDANHKGQHLGDSYYRDPNNEDSHHRGQHHGDSYHGGPQYAGVHDVGPPNAPRPYDSTTKQYPPTYSGALEKPLLHYPETVDAPRQYSKPADQTPPQQHNEDKNVPSLYTTDFNRPIHHTDSLPKDFQAPYFNNPPPDSELDSPQLNGPNVQIPEDKSLNLNFKSLTDFYKFFGFEPFDFNEMPLNSQYANEDGFRGKTEVSGPTSSSASADFHPDFKGSVYPGNTNPPQDHSYGNFRAPYSGPNYYSTEDSTNGGFKHSSAVRNENSPYNEQNPCDSNRSPTVSTEHSDIHETSQPGTYNTSPEGTSFEGELSTRFRDEKSIGIRVKDYDPKTFFDDPRKANMYNSGESEFTSSDSQPHTPLHPHPVVRQNPYNIKYPHSEEVITTYRPRVYRQNLKVETEVDSEHRSNNFNPKEVNINTSGGIRYPEPLIDHKDYRSRQPKTQQADKGLRFHDDGRHTKGNKTAQNFRSILPQGIFLYKEPKHRSKSVQSKRSSKKKGKRSSPRSPKKKKSNNNARHDRMQAEGSTYHWGMERHKGTDGFFQYVNVPGVKDFEYGYRMGGPEHTRERHHQTQGIQSKIKLNWEDGNGDSGDHYWEFNHDSREDDDEENTKKTRTTASEE